jgi:hypothetical protein
MAVGWSKNSVVSVVIVTVMMSMIAVDRNGSDVVNSVSFDRMISVVDPKLFFFSSVSQLLR